MAFDHRHLRLPIPPMLLTLAALPLGWSLWAAVQAGLDASAWAALWQEPQTLQALAMSLWTGLLASVLSTATAAWLLCRTFSALPGAAMSATLARGLVPTAASPHRRALAFNGLLWLGGLGGIAASLFSQTRGGWVVVPMVIVLVWRHLAPPGRGRRTYFSLLFLILLSIVTIVMQQRTFTQRWMEASNENRSYVASGVQTTSVGARLAMWTYALEQIQTHPWVGIGEEGWATSRDAAIRSKRLSPVIAEFNHVHNEFLDVTLKRGLVGLGLLLAMYILPSVYFLRFTKGHSAEVTSLAMAGLIIPISYIGFGLTQVFLGHNSGRMVLVSLWMTVAALLFNAVEKECELMSAKR